MADPLTGQPIHQIVQTKHDPITGETSKVVSPMPENNMDAGLPTQGTTYACLLTRTPGEMDRTLQLASKFFFVFFQIKMRRVFENNFLRFSKLEARSTLIFVMPL